MISFMDGRNVTHNQMDELRAISAPSIKLRTSVYLPSGEPENNIFQSSSLNFQTFVPPQNPGGIQSNLFLVYVPLHPLPYLK